MESPRKRPRSLTPINKRKGWNNGDGGSEGWSGRRPHPPTLGGKGSPSYRPSLSFPAPPPRPPRLMPPSCPPEPEAAAGEAAAPSPLTRPVPTPHSAPTSRPPRARYLLIEAADHGLDPFHRPVRSHVLPAAGGRRRDWSAGARAGKRAGSGG